MLAIMTSPLQSLGTQHLYTNSILLKLPTLCNVLVVRQFLHWNGDVVLVHWSPLGNIHPPSFIASLCTHDIGLSSNSWGKKYDPLGHELPLLNRQVPIVIKALFYYITVSE